MDLSVDPERGNLQRMTVVPKQHKPMTFLQAMIVPVGVAFCTRSGVRCPLWRLEVVCRRGNATTGRGGVCDSNRLSARVGIRRTQVIRIEGAWACLIVGQSSARATETLPNPAPASGSYGWDVPWRTRG